MELGICWIDVVETAENVDPMRFQPDATAMVSLGKGSPVMFAVPELEQLTQYPAPNAIVLTAWYPPE